MAFAVAFLSCVASGASAQLLGSRPSSLADAAVAPATESTLDDAQRLFYNAQYSAASALTLELRPADGADLANAELRTSSLLFELKALLEGPDDGRTKKGNALDTCATCPALIAAFVADTRAGQALARARLRTTPADEAALFYLGKLDLNYVWLQLGPLGRKTGWDEYWEARRSLDAVLAANPTHVRALVARAWIDYIVDTRMPMGTRWILGGGSRKRALAAIGSATRIDAAFFVHAEAEFALWNIWVRERNLTEATVVARRIARSFPENPEVAHFLQTRNATN